MVEIATRSRSSQRGVIIITLALCIVVLLGFLGMAVDVGYMQWTRRRAQTAADAAAMTAVAERWRGGTATSADALAKADSARNGFTDGQESTTVVLSASGSGTSTAVTATVTRVVPSYFMRVVGRDAVTVVARASAALGAGSGCVYALDPSANNAFVVTGMSHMTMNCGVVVASNGNNAFQLNGNGIMDMNNNTINVVGGTNVHGTINNGSLNTIANAGDPLFYIDIPSVDSVGSQMTLGSGTTVAVSPGIYCGGMNFAGSTTYNLAAGIYVIAGGRLTIQSGALVNGTGVTFVFATGSTYGCTGGARNLHGGIDINSGATVNLSAPTSGTYRDIVFFEDRNSPRANGNENTFNGSATVNIQGGMYFPVSGLTLNGNLDPCDFTFIIADTIKVNGNVDPTSLYSGGTQNSVIKAVVLTE